MNGFHPTSNSTPNSRTHRTAINCSIHREFPAKHKHKYELHNRLDGTEQRKKVPNSIPGSYLGSGSRRNITYILVPTAFCLIFSQNLKRNVYIHLKIFKKKCY